MIGELVQERVGFYQWVISDWKSTTKYPCTAFFATLQRNNDLTSHLSSNGLVTLPQKNTVEKPLCLKMPPKHGRHISALSVERTLIFQHECMI
jgi:hypothetical protein